MTQKYKIYEENGHLGIMAEDGTKMTPAVYDEIQTNHGDYYRCRAFWNWDWFCLESGQASCSFRSGGILPNGGSVNDEYTTLADRKFYDSISEWENDGNVYTYKNGKFGYKNEQGLTVLPTEFDVITRWNYGNVIEARKGDEYHYFDTQGNEILTGNQEKKGERFWDGHSNDTIAFRQIVEKQDDQTYQSEVGLVRIDIHSIDKFSEFLKKSADVLPIEKSALDLFNDRYSYEYDAYEVMIEQPTCEADWKMAIDRLGKIGAYENSWHMIDIFQTNENTKMKVNELYLLKHIYDTEQEVLSSYMSFGCDNSLADGEVRWIHCEFYHELCFPGGYEIADIMREGTLEELKAAIEETYWDETGDHYGGCFFHFGNFKYSEKRCWSESERVLDYMYSLGHNPHRLISDLIQDLKFQHINLSNDEIKFCKRCIEWGLAKVSFPNSLDLSWGRKTPYDDLLATIKKNKGKGSGKVFLLEEMRTLARSAGALTTEELFAKEKEHYATCDQYDYSVINHWKEF